MKQFYETYKDKPELSKQTMIAEYKTKLIDKSILQRKLAELYDIAEEEVKNSQQD